MNYEIHITLRTSNYNQFIEDCKEIGVKPIIIETQNGNEFSNQVMTSSKHSGSHYLFTLNDISSKLKNYEILRQKVEIEPQNEISPEHIYYESHLRLKLPHNFDYKPLYNLCYDLNFHLSKNLFKKSNEFLWQMITYRDYNSDINAFKNHINNMINQLKTLDIEYDKVEIEECVYDSNEKVDENWLK